MNIKSRITLPRLDRGPIHYLLLIIIAFGYLYLKANSLLKSTSFIHPTAYVDLWCPVILSISAALFLQKRTKQAAMIGLFGIAMLTKPIIIYTLLYFIPNDTKKDNLLGGILITTALVFIYLGYITIKYSLGNDQKGKDISYDNVVVWLSFLPSIIVLITIGWVYISIILR